MAKQYRQRDSGLLIPGNDSIELPKPKVPGPWYARGELYPAARFMGRRKCCCREAIEPCLCCGDDTTPDSFLILIRGISNNSCGDCTILNDDYVLSNYEGLDCGAGSWACIWRYQLEPQRCGLDYLCFITRKNDGGSCWFIMVIFVSSQGLTDIRNCIHPISQPYIYYLKYPPSPPAPFDCASFDEEPIDSDSISSPSNLCSRSTSPLVTAL